MELLGSMFVLIIFGALFGLIIASLFLLLSARIVGIENRSFGKSFLVVFLGGLASSALSAMLMALPIAGFIIGSIGGLILESIIMMAIFETEFSKALTAIIISSFMSMLVMGVLFAFLLLAIGGLTGLQGLSGFSGFSGFNIFF